jgi:hypothetical protein
MEPHGRKRCCCGFHSHGKKQWTSHTWKKKYAIRRWLPKVERLYVDADGRLRDWLTWIDYSAFPRSDGFYIRREKGKRGKSFQEKWNMRKDLE